MDDDKDKNKNVDYKYLKPEKVQLLGEGIEILVEVMADSTLGPEELKELAIDKVKKKLEEW